MTTITGPNRYVVFSASDVTGESWVTELWKNSEARSNIWSDMKRVLAVPGYKTSLRSTDLLNPDKLYVGSKRHVQIVDLLSCVLSEQDEDLVRLLGHGWTQQEVANEFGVDQSTISLWIRQLKSHAGA